MSSTVHNSDLGGFNNHMDTTPAETIEGMGVADDNVSFLSTPLLRTGHRLGTPMSSSQMGQPLSVKAKVKTNSNTNTKTNAKSSKDQPQ